MNPAFLIKRSDNSYVITYSLVDDNSAVINLTNATVQFNAGNDTQIVVSKPAVITNALSGEVTVTLLAADTLFSGLYNAEFVVTFQDGTVLSYPRSGYISLNIQRNVDPTQLSMLPDGTSPLEVLNARGGYPDLNSRLNVIYNGASPLEVVNARNGYTDLNSRLGNTDTLLAENVKHRIDLFNMKENGADFTGIVDCSSLLDTAQASGKTIYFPKGTYYINYWRPANGKGKVHMIGDGESTIINLNSILRPYDDWIVEDIQFVTVTASLSQSIFGLDPDSNGVTHNFTMRRCTCTTIHTTDANFLAIAITGSNILRLEQNTFYYGGIQLQNTVGTTYFQIKDNYFDTKFINTNEQIHLNENCSGIVWGNQMYNTLQDFIDLYVNGKSIIVENNRCIGFKQVCMEIKVIFRDVGDPSGYGNESNLIGAWKNYMIRNNHFSGGQNGSMTFFNLQTYENRAVPIVNDFAHYGRYITFEGNFIDDTELDGQSNAPIETDVRTVFAITGLMNVNLLNNKVVMNLGVKRIFYLSTSGNSTSTTSQITKNLRIEGNNITYKRGYTTTNKMVVINGGNVDWMIVKNNVFPYWSQILYNTDYPITNAVFDTNQFNDTDGATLTASDRHIWLYAGGSDIKFLNMTMWGFFVNTTLTNGQLINLDFVNCTFTSILSLGNINTLRFHLCKFPATGSNAALQVTAPVTTLFIMGCVLTGSSGYYLVNNSTITNYLPRDIFTDTTKASLWFGTIPTKTDLSAKY